MSLLEKYTTYIKKENLFQPKDKLLVAVSGGLDSVVLCELCKQAGFDFVMAHCNFQLRAEESDRDEDFVKKLAAKYGVDFFVKKFDTQAISKTAKKSIEETARDLRYGWFNELISNKQLPVADYVLTAHHADDNIETMLMNFFRGTGIKGMHGILPKQQQLVRPLLFAKKAELEAFAAMNGLQSVTDHTNAENEYTRNFFRNKVIPMVSERFPAANENILNNIRRFGEAEVLYRQAVAMHKKALMEHKGTEVHIPVLKLAKALPLETIVYEISSEFGFTAHQVPEIIALLQRETGKYVQSASHRIIRNRRWLIIAPNQPVEAAHILIEAGESNMQFAMGNLQARILPVVSSPLSTSSSVAMLDISGIRFPLLLRKWRRGDYFYPLGMQKKKKLGRFFTDQKLSLTQKEDAWVVESDKKILWVIGMRIDDRFKVTDKTKEVLQLSLISS